MTRPRLLDLFCGAGGAAMGYHRAGFDVTGVDIAPQPHYPFTFHQGDAITYPLKGFDAIHASPPCHDYSPVTGRNRKAQGVKGTGWMLAAIVDRLRHLGVPWIVENVGSAVFPPDVFVFRLCGSSFGLDVQRHRLFGAPVMLMSTPCHHASQARRFRSLDSRHQGGYLARVVGVHGHLNYPGERALREHAMGIDWMTTAELAQAIPPAYTQHIGHELLAARVSPLDGSRV
jgi:DNA (cytosine-5)-methyltransferase 1